jgi:hypothetical protein
LAEATFEQKRQLVELLIDRVIVTMDEVEIRYVIPTSPRCFQDPPSFSPVRGLYPVSIASALKLILS